MARENSQLKLRIPADLRDRIKTYADRHERSMNAEILRVLEREFPEPWELDYRLSLLMGLTETLRRAAPDEFVDQLTHEIRETLKAMAAGRMVKIDDETRAHISTQIEDLEVLEAQRYWKERWALDPEEEEAYFRLGSTAKHVRVSEPDNSGTEN